MMEGYPIHSGGDTVKEVKLLELGVASLASMTPAVATLRQSTEKLPARNVSTELLVEK
jgi:hypothetical protein